MGTKLRRPWSATPPARVDVTAAILAGGLGTRLRSVVADRPKALAPVGGRPFVTILLDQLQRAGFQHAVLLTGHQAEQVEEALGASHGPMTLSYSVEPTPLGTGGALRRALPRIDTETILLLNGDSYCDLDWSDFLPAHDRGGADLTMVLAKVDATDRFGRVTTGENGRVAQFHEKEPGVGPGWINAGIYLLERALALEIPPDRAMALERDLLPAWVRQNRVQGFQCSGAFLDIGTPESFAQAERFFVSVQQSAHGSPKTGLSGLPLDSIDPGQAESRPLR